MLQADEGEVGVAMRNLNVKTNSEQDREERRRPLSNSAAESVGRMSHLHIQSKTDLIYHNPSMSEYVWLSTKEVLSGSRLNVLMLLCPVVPVASAMGWGDGPVFALSLLSIAPFAERLGFITEQLAMHTNDTLGGLLNATFGNATELIISLFALLKGRPGVSTNETPELYRRLVQISLLGSILSNLLLVFGSALLIGGLRHREQLFNKMGANVSVALLLLVSGTLLGPAVLVGSGKSTEHDMLSFSRFASGLLFGLYGLFLVFQLRTHRDYYEDDAPPVIGGPGSPRFEMLRKTSDLNPGAVVESQSPTSQAPAAISIGGGDPSTMSPTRKARGHSLMQQDAAQQEHDAGNSVFLARVQPIESADLPGRAFNEPGANAFHSDSGEFTRNSGLESEDDDEDDDEDELILGFRTAMAWLGVISVAIAVLSEFLVDAIKGAAVAWSVPEEFIGAILIPVVGNAAEHASAVVFAYRNKMDISVGVALGSATQIGVSVLPACVLLGWSIECPLDLLFEPFEVLALFIAVLVVGAVVQDGKSHWLYGLVLCWAYAIVAAGFWYHN